jgi:hypothetical protein
MNFIGIKGVTSATGPPPVRIVPSMARGRQTAAAAALLATCLAACAAPGAGMMPLYDVVTAWASGNYHSGAAPGSADPSLSWDSLASCKAECTRLAQRCTLHDVSYTEAGVSAWMACAVGCLAAALGAALAALATSMRAQRAQASTAAAREAELLRRCEGIRRQAANLGGIAQIRSLELLQTAAELAATQDKLLATQANLRDGRVRRD